MKILSSTILFFLFLLVFACKEDKLEKMGDQVPQVIVERDKKDLNNPEKVDSNSSIKKEIPGKSELRERKNETEVIKDVSIKTIKDTLGWGYDIYIDGVKYVHQPHIPGINGLKGFQSETDARKVAELMVYKIKNNIMPPSVSLAELDSLKITK